MHSIQGYFTGAGALHQWSNLEGYGLAPWAPFYQHGLT